MLITIDSEAATSGVLERCSLKCGKIHRKTPVPESLFHKVAGLKPATLLKKTLWHICFPVNFAKFTRTPLLTEHLRWLLLKIESLCCRMLRLRGVFKNGPSKIH